MATDTSSDRPRKRGILFKLGIVLITLVVLLVAAFFVVTSSAFFKGVILPKVGASMNSDITVSSASIGLSEVTLNDLKLVPHGRDQLLQAQVVRTRFSLSDIIGGNIVVHELMLQSPVITVVKNADGSSNLDPLTQKKSAAEEKKTASQQPASKESKQQKIDITNVAIKNAQVAMTEKLKGGGQKLTQISDFNFSVDRLQNGQPGKLQISGIAKLSERAEAGEVGILAAKLSGNFEYKLANDLLPQSVQGSAKGQVTTASGGFAEAESSAVTLTCNLTPTKIQSLALQFQRDGKDLGKLIVSGPYSAEKKEGRFSVNVVGTDQQLLNILGGSYGIDFNQTKINSTNEIVVSQNGNTIAITGDFSAAQFSATRKAEHLTTPPLDLKISYQVVVDDAKQTALLQKLQITGTQNQQQILTGNLSKPMPVSWGQGAGVPDEAAFTLNVNNLNLADWKAFAADLAPSGALTVALNLVSKNAGKQLTLDLNTHLANFGAKFGSNQIANADIQLTAKGDVADLKKINLSEYQLKLAQQNQPSVTLAGSGTVDISTKATDLKATLDANIPQLLHTVAVPGVNVTSGDVKFDGHIVQTGNSQVVTGQLALLNFSGALDKTKLDRLAAQLNVDISMLGSDLTINKLNGSLTQADQPAGNFDVSGKWNLSNKVGQIAAKLVGVNERALGPFLASSLNGQQLVSVQVDGTASANVQNANGGAVNADLTVANLLVRDPAHPSTNAPLNAHFVVDGSMQANVLNLKNASIALSPTQRAKNELQLSGQVDLSKSNNIVANLTAHSDALDVTQWYDLYAKPKSTTAAQPQAAAQPTASASTSNANTEPAPIHLPIQKATVDVSIGHLYLHDLDVTEKCTLNISDNTHVVIDPLEITINNAPIKANVDLDLSVPGYKYNLTFTADKVPVGALADTFAPESKGAYKGDLIANANFQGQGTTGTSLREHLNGQANFMLTNANVKLSLSKKWKDVLSVVALVLQTPEINQSPLTLLTMNVGAGNGQLQLKDVNVQGAAYQATTQGTIPIADVLTNSALNLPVKLSLANNLAQRSHLSQNANSTSGYSALPNFLTIVGTVGAPKPKTDKVALALTTAGAISGILGGKGGSAVQQGTGLVNQLFGGGQTQAGTTANPTNAPAPATSNQNKPSGKDLINGALNFFGKPKK